MQRKLSLSMRTGRVAGLWKSGGRQLEHGRRYYVWMVTRSKWFLEIILWGGTSNILARSMERFEQELSRVNKLIGTASHPSLEVEN